MRPQQYQFENQGAVRHFLATGLTTCFDSTGKPISCEDSGQDAEYKSGVAWPKPRFSIAGDGLVRDLLTGLEWPQNASPGEFPLTWQESLDAIREMNRQDFLGHADWRMPNRREMRSLISHGARNPALPDGHPFQGVATTWYWTSTTSAMAQGYAWYAHLAGGRMFYGRKDGVSMFWPVRGQSRVLPRTGQRLCFGADGNLLECAQTGHDAEVMAGAAWPEPRFTVDGEEVLDRLTGLVWHREADLAKGPVAWDEALRVARGLADSTGIKWRLPNINELESLVDASTANPALPKGHPFKGVGQAYWSSTTSFYEPDWSYCLYLHKGAVGVGYKAGPEFLVWVVR